MPNRRVIPVLLALLLLPAAARGQETAAQVDAIFARWSLPTSPGCAVAVGKEGQTLLSRAYGMAELEHEAPNRPETVFEAGSVSKQFTAAAIVLLARDGKLSLEDDVRKYVPELPDYGATLTIRHLITHTSGLRDWGTVVAAAGWPRGARAHTHAHVLDVVARQRALNFAPGAEYLYSNTGYNLLAIIVERVAGEPFADFTRKRIFEPLGMRSTQWRDDHTRIVKGRATAYAGASGAFRSQMPFEDVHGNGGLLTTVGDLLLWNENFVHGKVGGPAFVAELQRQGRLASGRTIEYAGGLFVTDYDGIPEVSHSGATAGYRAFLARYPEERLSVAVLCNLASTNPTALARQVADLYLSAQKKAAPTPPRTTRQPAAEVAAKAGLYRNLRTGEPLRLVAQEGELRMERGGRLVPLSRTLFQVGTGEGRVVFDLEPRGRPTALRLLTADGDTVAHQPVAEFAPTPAQLAEYAGEYYSDEAEAAYTAALADGRLVLRRRPGVTIPLTPAYADAFTSPLGLVRFTRDAAGRVTGLSLGLGRVRDLPFARVGDRD